MNSQIKQNIPPVSDGYQSLCPEDEINLLDIWRVLVRQRKWILFITIIIFSLAVAYSLFSPRVYQAEAILLPPLSSDVARLNIRLPDTDNENYPNQQQYLYETSTEKLYAKFMENLHSVGLRQQFFKQNNLLAALTKDKDSEIKPNEIFKHKFQELITIKKAAKNKTSANNAVSITLEGAQPDLVAKWLNNFISFADLHTVTLVANTLNTTLDMQKKDLQERIKILRKSAQNRRLDSIAALEEASQIAEKLKLLEPADSLGNQNNKSDNLKLSTVVNTKEQPLYLRGSKALRAEVESLKNRKNDDHFIPGLRDLQDRLEFLENIHLDAEAIHAVRIDQPAYSPDSPIKPKRKLIAALGLVLGLMLGVFAAFMINFIDTANKKENDA